MTDISAEEEYVTAPPIKEHIPSNLLSFNMLEGEYRSFMLGRSDDYEDLREYQYGDSVRDIDWKATARSNEPVIRRFRQEKHHNLIFLVDTGLNMQGLSPQRTTKLQTGLRAAGALMHLALSNRDTVEVLFAYRTGIEGTGKTGERGSLNTALNTARTKSGNHTGLYSDTSLATLLHAVQSQTRTRSIIVAVADLNAVNLSRELLRQVAHRHHLLVITVEDLAHASDSSGETYIDIATLNALPDSLRTDPKIVEEYHQYMKQKRSDSDSFLAGIHTRHISLGDDSQIIPKLHELITAEEGQL